MSNETLYEHKIRFVSPCSDFNSPELRRLLNKFYHAVKATYTSEKGRVHEL